MDHYRILAARTSLRLQTMMKRGLWPTSGGRGLASPHLPVSDTTTARLDVLEAQLRHVEAALEGLQDAVHRRALLDDRRNEDLQQRTQPARLARDLSDDARARSMSNHDESDLERARAEVRYQRERLALYRARMYRQPASPASKLHELERALQGAQERLRRAEHDRP